MGGWARNGSYDLTFTKARHAHEPFCSLKGGPCWCTEFRESDALLARIAVWARYRGLLVSEGRNYLRVWGLRKGVSWLDEEVYALVRSMPAMSSPSGLADAG